MKIFSDEGLIAAVIAQQEEEAKELLSDPRSLFRLLAVTHGLKACRGKSPHELLRLWTEIEHKAVEAKKNNVWDHKDLRREQVVIGNVLAVYSAAAIITNRLPLYPPVVGDLKKAGRILGIISEKSEDEDMERLLSFLSKSQPSMPAPTTRLRPPSLAR